MATTFTGLKLQGDLGKAGAMRAPRSHELTKDGESGDILGIWWYITISKYMIRKYIISKYMISKYMISKYMIGKYMISKYIMGYD